MREMTAYYRKFMYLRTLLLLLLPFNSWIAVNSLSAQDNDRQLRYDAFFLEAMMQREQFAGEEDQKVLPQSLKLQVRLKLKKSNLQVKMVVNIMKFMLEILKVMDIMLSHLVLF